MKSAHFYSIFFLLLILASCKSTEVATVEPGPSEENEVETEVPSSALLMQEDLQRFRNTLAEPFLNAQNKIASVFELTDDDLESVDSRSGFRIQLLSTDDIDEADKVSMDYYDWAVKNELPYERIPESYVLFRQPYYRVRVGDFRSRSKAIEYLNMLRPHFQGAWIVMDTIEPDRVP